MRIAMLGGSFNPIHIGHCALADEVRLRLNYDKIIFVPAHISPFKQDSKPADDYHRIRMLKSVIRQNKAFDYDLCEIKRGGVSYTIDTLHYLAAKYSGKIEGRIGLIIGDDLVEGFDRWHSAKEISETADLILARRYNEAGIDFAYPHKTVQNSILTVSSSEIRQKIENGESFRYLVPFSVYRYITKRHLYGFDTKTNADNN